MALLRGYGIDLGQHSVKLVELGKDRSGVRLLRARIAETGISYSMSKEAKDEAMSSALKKVLKGVNAGQSNVSIATPGLSAFIRYVKLPAVTPQKLKQIIGYEAQQQVPFPLNEVVWDYQALEANGESEINVVLVAIKKDVLSSFIKLVKNCGIDPTFVEHRPLAVYNSFCFNREKNDSEVVVLIDVGEKTTDISVERNGELCWTRSARTGSSDITEAIRKKYGISFEEADSFKREAAEILVTDEEEKSADKKTLELWNAIKSPVSAISSELQRTINYFQTQLGGTKADRIIIAGGLSMMPNIDKFLGAVIRAEVEKLNPLKRISAEEGVLSGIDAGAQLSVAVGLGLRSLDEGFSTINLLPENVVSMQKLKKKRAYLILSGISLALMIGISSAFTVANYNVAKRNLEKAQEDMGKYREYSDLISREREKQKAIDAKIENIQGLVYEFWRWPDFLFAAARAIPDGIVLSDLRFVTASTRRDGRRRAEPVSVSRNLELKGRARDFDSVSELIAVIESSPGFKSVEVISANPVTGTVRRRIEVRDNRATPPHAGWEAVSREFIEFVIRVEVN